MSRRRLISLLVLLPIAAGAAALAGVWSAKPETPPAPRPAPTHSDSEEPREPPLFARLSIDAGFRSTSARSDAAGDDSHALAGLQAFDSAHDHHVAIRCNGGDSERMDAQERAP